MARAADLSCSVWLAMVGPEMRLDSAVTGSKTVVASESVFSGREDFCLTGSGAREPTSAGLASL